MVTIRNGEHYDIEQIMLLDKECFGIDIEPINSEKNKKMLYSKDFWEYLLRHAYCFLVVCDDNSFIVISVCLFSFTKKIKYCFNFFTFS